MDRIANIITSSNIQDGTSPTISVLGATALQNIGTERIVWACESQNDPPLFKKIIASPTDESELVASFSWCIEEVVNECGLVLLNTETTGWLPVSQWKQHDLKPDHVIAPKCVAKSEKMECWDRNAKKMSPDNRARYLAQYKENALKPDVPELPQIMHSIPCWSLRDSLIVCEAKLSILGKNGWQQGLNALEKSIATKGFGALVNYLKQLSPNVKKLQWPAYGILYDVEGLWLCSALHDGTISNVVMLPWTQNGFIFLLMIFISLFTFFFFFSFSRWTSSVEELY
jgi:hypothetical protein